MYCRFQPMRIRNQAIAKLTLGPQGFDRRHAGAIAFGYPRERWV
jgi:hypothetical protein